MFFIGNAVPDRTAPIATFNRIFAGVLATVLFCVQAYAETPDGTVRDTGIFLTGGEGNTVPFEQALPEGAAILHFWATWCAPCREELPALDSFAGELGRRDSLASLVAVSVDTVSYEKVEAFMTGLAIEHLPAWQVRGGNPGVAFRLFGYPATILIDADGSIVERFSGPVRWGDEAVREKLLRHLGLAPAL